MSSLNSINGFRCMFILKHLQNLLDDSIPTTRDFCKYRNEIILHENLSGCQGLVDREARLSEEVHRLEKQLQELKDHEKKKVFVDTRARLYTVRNNIKEVSRHLNKRFCESTVVMDNIAKLQSVFGLLKQKLDRKDVEAYLSGQEDPILSTSLAEKKESIVYLYTSLQSEMAALKLRQTTSALKKAEIESIKNETSEIERELIHKKNIGSSHHRLRINQMKESRLQEMELVERDIKSEIAETTKDIVDEEKRHESILKDYTNKISSINTSIDNLRNKHNNELKDLNRELRKLKQQREESLKCLLELKMTWNRYEDNKRTEADEETNMKAIHDQKVKEHQSAIILQNKIRELFSSKLKKTASKGIAKKKKREKVKKKRKN